MRKGLLVILCTLIFSLSYSQGLKNPDIIVGRRTAITPRLSTWKPDMNDPRLKIKTRDENGLIFARDNQPLPSTDYGSKHTGPDPVLQQAFPNQAQPGNNPDQPLTLTPTLEIDGGIIQGNFDGVNFSNVSPADPTIAVGPNHIVQMVNGQNGSALFRIFSKAGGSLSLQAFMDQLPGTRYNGAGDCITWYDQLTDRFVMTEFGDSSATGTAVNTLIFAVSQTGDPLGSWYIYEFSDASFFPDYPKYGNWHDAWYGVTRDFTGGYLGNSVYAFDKNKMLAGDPTATVQRFRFSDPENKYNSMAPVSLAGSTPAPAGTPGLFLYYNDDNFTSSATDVDSIGIINFHADFTNPSNSYARIEQNMMVAPFKGNVCASRNCAPSPTGNGYDVISNRFMNRPYYRNYGSHQALVANHTVDATGTGISGLRWYELRNTGGGWNLRQQSTYSPQTILPCVSSPSQHRFFGAITLNNQGQLALAYNISSAAQFASIGFTGRNASDPLNLMSYEEVEAVHGTGYGTFGNRWGDYNEIVPDISNDSVFWFTAMYGFGTNQWRTRIISFKLAPNFELDAKLLAIDDPTPCANSCDVNLGPRIRFKNLGNTTLSSLKVNMSVNNGPVSVVTWTGNLPISSIASFTLPTTSFITGPNTLKIFLSDPNGGTDENTLNDTISVQVEIGAGSVLPISEGFENTTFPPSGWTQANSTGDPGFNWQRVSGASHSGNASARFDNFNQNQQDQYADLRTPLLDVKGADSVGLSFWVAAAIFDNFSTDTLEVLVSSDCGNNFTSVYKKAGRELATRAGYVQTEFTPSLVSDWRQETISLNAFAGSDRMLIAFRNINRFGNNIYIDDIQITKSVFPDHDVAVISIDEPLDFSCSDPLIPRVRFSNQGKDTLRWANFNYRLDNGPLQTIQWTGTLGRLQSDTFSLPAANPGPGTHRIRVYSTEPNGLPDENTSNDSLRRNFTQKVLQSLPVSEGFEGATFPPAQWDRINPDASFSWVATISSSVDGLTSIYINNYRYPNLGARDDMVSPLMTYSDADSVYLSFYVAASTYSYPGSTTIPLDTLEVLVSTDCGKTFTSVYKKWGTELQTVNKPNEPNVTEFHPTSKSEWRKELLNLTPLLGTSNTFIVTFRNINNFENNIYLDDINIYTKNLPAKLKQNGYLITPNPFTSRLTIQQYPNANNLKGIEIFNTAGQLVYSKSMATGSADAYIQLDLGKLSPGMYNIRLTYTDRVEFEKVIKLR